MFPVSPPQDQSEITIVSVPESFTCSKCTPSDRKNPSIYTTGTRNRKFYEPQVVSFGPYHYDKSDLKPMEEHKNHARLHLVERSEQPEESFLESLRVREVAQDLKESYQTLDEKPKNNRAKGILADEKNFLNLMFRDGCFMLEIMRTRVGEKRYARKDPIFNYSKKKYITPIQRDMLLLENQLPIRVLYRLVAVENNGEEHDQYEKVNGLILKFYSLSECVQGECLHVLDVFRKGLLMKPKQQQMATELDKTILDRLILKFYSLNKCVKGRLKEPKPQQSAIKLDETIQSATELEASIRFEKSKTDCLDDISFSDGVLSLPRMEVNDTTQSRFLNLMTFERLHVGAGNEITCYVTFMDNIINNKRDVELLLPQGIIKNALGNKTEVAKLFNSLCKEVPPQSNERLDHVQKKISEYRQKCWNRGRAALKRWGANLNRTYFRSPWSILSVVAAIFLFALTIIQTVYAVLSYNSQMDGPPKTG